METPFMDINLEFNLVKSKLDEKDLRAYLYQCIYQSDNNQVCFHDVKDLYILTDEQLRNWNDGRDLKLLNYEQLNLLFDKLGYSYPEYIYFFNPSYDFDREDYRSYPQIFSCIESLSFDNGGLIVLFSDILSGYQLFTSKGTELLRSNYSTIKIGMNGLIQFDNYSDEEDKSTSEIAVNWNQLNSNYQVDLYGNKEANFPDIKGRDKIFETDRTENVYSKADLEQLVDEEIAKKILEEDGCLIRNMSKLFQENKELAFSACLQNKLAFTLLPEELQKDTNFITRLLDSKEVDSDIRNYIYFERKAVEVAIEKISTHEDTAIEEVAENVTNTQINEPLIPLWNPLIIDRFDSITPNLTKKEPNYFELLAYLYQLINSDFIFAEPLTKKYSEILDTRPVEEIMKDTELQYEIEDSLWQEGCYPHYIYIFNQRTQIHKSNYKIYPKIYTDIVDITFDKGGLLVMESFRDQVHSLHDIAGDILLWKCSDIIVGMDGLIAYRCADDLSGLWTFKRYENGGLNSYSPESENYIKYDYNLNDFPFIYRRDKIPYLKSWEQPYCHPFWLALLNNRKTIMSILKEDGCLIRYMQDWAKEDEELALLACQKEIAFTLISKKLQQDKSFVIKLYSMPNIDVNIFIYFNMKLQNDPEIIKIKLKKIRIEEELFDEKQKKLTSQYGESDELPF